MLIRLSVKFHLLVSVAGIKIVGNAVFSAGRQSNLYFQWIRLQIRYPFLLARVFLLLSTPPHGDRPGR
jgi:hypothetical protein